ncbi:DUF4199 domain-containing protein [Altibacter sp.]|uniref:DUF4199 domain-containing protein n=1 Tax=Altibacter sp. TaxID=2024823 RepID=UPI00258E1B64|nr:DUF4199 domain-containing protein [Altibacter sp.]MCW9036359.1 DUF4199 domain-containing protein [Altibacter sp.]
MGKYYIKYGIGIAMALIAYFLLTKLLGLHQYPILSAANGVIFGAGILMAMKSYKTDKTNFKYQKGFQIGLFSGGIATVLFAAFMSLYIFQIDTQFAEAILDSWGLSYNKGSLIVIMSLVIMGFATTLVLTLAFMQLLKESWNTKS